MVDFVLVAVIVVPLFLGILQIGLFLYLRTTMTAAASEGAHHAALFDREPADGVARTRELVDGVISEQLVDDVTAEPVELDGQPGVRIAIDARMPALGLWGPGVDFSVEGHAVKETGQ